MSTYDDIMVVCGITVFIGIVVILYDFSIPRKMVRFFIPDDRITAQQFITAMGIVESDNNPNAPLGDDGRAFGRWQMHPDWWDEWQPKSGIRAVIGDTWDSWQVRVLTYFFNYHPTIDPVMLAMYYHLGHIAQSSDADWDAEYAAKFENAVAVLGL